MTETNAIDPFELRKHYRHLRVVDVCDAMDGIGYFNVGLVSSDIRPLWPGMKFWGVAFTVRCVPANTPMWQLHSTQDVVNAHGIWFDKIGRGAWGFYGQLRQGHVVVTDTGGADSVGLWGSENSMSAIEAGAVGIVTSGECRDTAEVVLQKTPVCAMRRGRTIIPGRIEIIETQTRIGCGGVQVCPGDIVGCDDDGVVVVPQAVAAQVAAHGKAILLADMKKRRQHYQKLGIVMDASVDHETIARYYDELGAL
jgi:regulator of RNase E activity RraA